MISSFQSPLLSKIDWEPYFSAEVYKTTTEQKGTFSNHSVSMEEQTEIKLHRLKYLIVRDQPTQTIEKWVEKCKISYSQELHAPFTNHALTALHLAVMKNRKDVTKKLSEAGANPNVADAYGWTSLHHAALISASTRYGNFLIF